jgi:pimeloyl-ACP methyl ester carboxylesterase
LDQRGTGLSTAISPETLPSRLVTDQDKADYLKHFRADSIVKDCEEIRKVLLGDKPNPEDRKWTIWGQSFGGFCAITYLSFFPSALKEVFLSGGLAPLEESPDRVYTSLIRESPLFFIPDLTLRIIQPFCVNGMRYTTENILKIYSAQVYLSGHYLNLT